ncbi:MAG TPA: ATP-binding protein [Vicinamibacterales bacterium]
MAVADLAVANAAWAQRQKQVLVLYSTRRDAEIVVVGDRELPKVLDHGLPGGLDYYSEFLDQARTAGPDYPAAFRDFLRLKYQDKRFDLVIAVGDGPLEFIRGNQGFFADTPVVFFSSSRTPRRIGNSTGVTAELNLTGTLVLARAMQPDVRNVFIVSGAHEADKAYEAFARAQFRSFEGRLSFTYLAGLPTQELEARLATLPPHSIVYYLVVDRDGANENFQPLEYLDRIAEVANAPVYCWVDSAMDHGIVGGSLKDQVAEMYAIGELALKVLRGQRPDDIPLLSRDLNVSQVDWRQLQRWGISEARVPAGTLVRFREPSVWQRYRAYILGSIAIVLAQTSLIAGLLVQRKRRQQAEAQLRESQAALRSSYERIRDLGSRLLSAQDTERSRIARELHDDVSQVMALLMLDLSLLSRAGKEEMQKLSGEALKRARSVATSVHELSHRLHPANLRLLGLVSAIESLQDDMSHHPVSIAFTHENVPRQLPAELTLSLFRVAQQALQNAIEHGHATRVAIDLRGGPDGLTLTVIDDGVGFDVDAAWGKGLGLISMSERAKAIGGTLAIHSAPGAGTRLNVVMPVGVADAAEMRAV